MSAANIIIAGDSWGCGEWSNSNNNYGISHYGLAQYLLDAGYQVINLSQPGGANKNSSDRVASFLGHNRHLNIAGVIVFQTEWVRDIFVESPVIVSEDVKHGYHDLKNRIMSRFYNYLSQASVQYEVPIYLVGGCSDTIWLDRFAEEYPGLQIACQSLTNLLINNDHRTSSTVQAIFTKGEEPEVEYIKQYLNSRDLQLLLDDIELGHQRLTAWQQNEEYFWPDGAHANQLGHQVLYQWLQTQIPNL
jgi:hypothetical protein